MPNDLSGGTPPPDRDPSLGAAFDKKWWPGVADKILRHFLPYGAGDGPDPALVDPLSNGLQSVFGAQKSEDLGESNVRKFLKSPKSTTDNLSDELMLSLGGRATEAVQNRIASETGGLFPESKRKSLAVDPNRPRPSSSGSDLADKPKRPYPRRSGQPEDYWRSLGSADQSFMGERNARGDVYDTFLNSFESREQEKFSKDANVQVNEAAWQARHKAALAIGAGAQFSIDDDTYHIPSINQAPNRSNWLIGSIVHAAWQIQYAASRWQDDILAEYLVSKGGTPTGGKRVRGELIDYRTIDTSEEAPTYYGAARFAFGKYRPDLIDFTQRTVYEIKPIRAAASGVLQLWRYTHNFNCARYFDELYSAGAAGKDRYFLTPAPLKGSPFSAIELTEYVDAYLGDKNNKNAKYKPEWVDMVRLRASGKRIYAVPILVPAIPGLVLYSIYDKKKPGEAEQKQITDLIKTGLIVVTTVAIIAAIVAVTIATAGSADVVAATLLGGEASELAAGEVVVDIMGDSMVVSQIPDVSAAFNSALGQLVPVLP